MGRSDDYVRVKLILVTRTQNAVLVHRVNNDIKEDPFWLPLSLIHAADEKKIDNSMATEVIEFRIREWKADELDL